LLHRVNQYIFDVVGYVTFRVLKATEFKIAEQYNSTIFGKE